MAGVATVRIEPLGVELAVAECETIIQAAWREGYYWPTICDGEGRCGQCQFTVERGEDNLLPAGESEQRIVRLIERRGGKAPIRLACRAFVVGRVVAIQPGVRSVSKAACG